MKINAPNREENAQIYKLSFWSNERGEAQGNHQKTIILTQMSEKKNQETRKCEVCGEMKPVADFSKSYRNRCKACVAAEARMHRAVQAPAAERECTMMWRKLTLTDELIGMHVLVKGYNHTTNKWFYALGYIDKYSNEFSLRREEDKERGFIENVRIFNRSISYFYINIDKIQ